MKKGKIGKKIIYSVLLILIIIAVALVGFFLDYTKNCQDQNCFDNAMNSCKKAYFIREDDKAAWSYDIKEKVDDKCAVEVTLLKLKKGNIDIEKLENKKMNCIVEKGTQFPEEIIANCKGELKEELQDIIITRMHDYILKNLGEIKEEFSGF